MRRAPRPPMTQTRLYRVLVPAALVTLALTAAVILVLAGGVLVGIVPYPGK